MRVAIKSIDVLKLFCAALLCTVVISLFYSSMMYVCFALGLLAVVVLSGEDTFAFLLFLFPFALVMKTWSGGTSLFTYIEIFAVLLLLIRKNTIDGVLFISLFLLLFIMLVNVPGIVTLVKFFNILILYYLFVSYYQRQNASKYFTAFAVGFMASTILGIFKVQIPRLATFYTDLNTERILGDAYSRFSGLFNDPNYFCIPVMLCIVYGMNMMVKGKRSTLKWGMVVAAAAVAGAFTLSKSFYLLLAAVLILLGVNSRKGLRNVCVMGVIIAVFCVVNPNDIIGKILYRFSSYDLTTGRIEIWSGYIPSIVESVRSLFFGQGLDAAYISRAEHSIVIELLYRIGICGMVLYYVCLFRITVFNKRRFKRCLNNYMGYVIVFIQYLFLCGITAYEMPFYLMICYIIYDYNYQERADQSVLLPDKRNQG